MIILGRKLRKLKKLQNTLLNNEIKILKSLDHPNILKKEIYILPYELKDENKYPAGKIQSIDKRDYTIEHDCNNIDKKDK